MLDLEINKISEKRGRFIIQEIEEEVECSNNTACYTGKTNNFSDRMKHVVSSTTLHSNHIIMNNSKRPRHSSIIMDSKIIHTTRMDSNYSNEIFSSFVLAENIWVDFNEIWKDFSKCHCDVSEDDMEKIFHYIDKKIEESDYFSMNNSNEPFPIMNKLKEFEEKQKMISEDENVICSEIKNNNEINLIDKNVEINKDEINSDEINNDVVNKDEITLIENKRKTKYRHSNRSLILTNFYCNRIVSPPISPINSYDKIKNQFDTENLVKLDRELPFRDYFKNKLGVLNKKRCLTQSEKSNKKFKFYNDELEDNLELTEENKNCLLLNYNINNHLKVVKNIQFSIQASKRNGDPNNFSMSTTNTSNTNFKIFNVIQENFQINKENEKNKEDNICVICKNILK